MITGEPHYARVCIVRLARSDVDTDVDELLPTAPPQNAQLARRRPDGNKFSFALSFYALYCILRSGLLALKWLRDVSRWAWDEVMGAGSGGVDRRIAVDRHRKSGGGTSGIPCPPGSDSPRMPRVKTPGWGTISNCPRRG